MEDRCRSGQNVSRTMNSTLLILNRPDCEAIRREEITSKLTDMHYHI